ncbi:Scr1 family TA system antitoxin-like transcriptional regulator [Streptomyces sp. NPDC001407]|uniref:helix-turn-helix domain-containing protein n=1 Tax=unclassified Streptomyces TaxID=2593676 RepID=UPI0036C87A5A
MSSLPPINWRYCGNQMKLWRALAGVSREDLAKEANYGAETVKSMEQGRRRPTLRLLQVADEMCGANGLLLASHAYLGPEKSDRLTHDFMLYEAEAIAISSFQPQLIPGLLQTEETARALLEGTWPPVDDKTIEDRIVARLARQKLLERLGTSFEFVIGEVAVRYPVGSMDAHKRQLQRLLDVGEQRNVTVQVLPAGGAHVGLNGPLVLLETAEHDRLGFEEGQTVALLYAEAEKINIAVKRHALIGRLALSPKESACYIRKLMEEL